MNFCQDKNIRLEKKWVSQFGRFNKKLDPDYFLVDEKTLSDFFDFAAKFGQSVSYFNDHNRPDGDWSVFFRNDPTLSLFFLQSLNTERWMKLSGDILYQFEVAKTDERKLYSIGKYIDLTLEIFSEVEKCAVNLETYPEFQAILIKYIKTRFSKFFSVIIESKRLLSKTYQATNIGEEFSTSFKSYWHSETGFSFSNDDDLIASVFHVISKKMPRIIGHTETIKKEAHQYLSGNVLGKGDIKPHIALFIAFCDLYKNAQRKINSISARHLDHHFKEILEFKPKAGSSDSVFLTMKLTSGSDVVQLAEGTKFNYKAAGNEIMEYFTLEKPAELQEGNIIRINGMNVSEFLWRDSFMNGSLVEHSVFDALAPETNQALGFEITSEYLILEEGERRITFDFTVGRLELIRFKERIKDIYLGADLNFVNSLIKNTWKLQYSNPAGWQDVSNNGLNISFSEDLINENAKLSFDVLIRKHDLPLTPFADDELNNEAKVRFVLSETGSRLYSLFKDIVFSRVKIKIAVLDVKDLILSNDFGPLPVGKPIEPFGPQPKLGAGFYVGHKNLFLKPITDVVVNFEWNNLPRDNNGFKGYYHSYNGIENNTCFKAKIAFLKDRSWIPSQNKQVVSLFTGIPENGSIENGPLSLVRRINEIDIRALGLNTRARINGPLLSYGPNSTDGFLKFELCYPLVAFGHDQYPDLIKKAAFNSARSKEEPETINEPYTPALKNVSLEFRSEIEINENDHKTRINRIHPFGKETIRNINGFSLLPFISKGGTILIGLEPLLNNKEISLLFKLSNKYVSLDDRKSNSIKVSYPDGGTWKELPPDSITYDSSNELQCTGIMKLKLPATDHLNNGIDNALMWLRFDLYLADLGAYIENVHLNAIKVVRDNVISINSGHAEAFSIKEMKDELVQIEKIEQPYRSFGAKTPESEENFRLHVSERIQHRGRAVSDQDIEQMLLGEFENIQCLKCLHHTGTNMRSEPGSVIVAVVPVANEDNNEIERYFPKQDLLKMQNYINARTINGGKISVVNPIYERIRLKFNVKFVEGYNEKLAVKKLNEKIISFLNPWTSEKLSGYGGMIPSTVILNEIELENYIDFITNFSVFHVVNNEVINISIAQRNDLILKGSSPISVLIPDLNHKILPYDQQMATDKPGINDMMIGNDFLVKTYLSDSFIGLGFDSLEKTFKVPDIGKTDEEKKRIFKLYLNE